MSYSLQSARRDASLLLSWKNIVPSRSPDVDVVCAHAQVQESDSRHLHPEKLGVFMSSR